MNDLERLAGPDISDHLRQPNSFGVTGASAPDGVPTIEFTTNPAVHGAHGVVRARFGPAVDAGLVAAISWGARGHATCRSADSIRVWGSFSPDAELEIRAPGAVRLIARSAAGAVLAGPIMVSPDHTPPSLVW